MDIREMNDELVVVISTQELRTIRAACMEFVGLQTKWEPDNQEIADSLLTDIDAYLE